MTPYSELRAAFRRWPRLLPAVIAAAALAGMYWGYHVLGPLLVR